MGNSWNESVEIQAIQNELREATLVNTKLIEMHRLFDKYTLTEGQKMQIVTAFDRLDESDDVSEASRRIEDKLDRIHRSNRSRSIEEAFGGSLRNSNKLNEHSTVRNNSTNDKVSRLQQLAGMKDPYSTK